jgi:hypothetical protein
MAMLMVTIGFSIRAQWAADSLEVSHIDPVQNSWTCLAAWSDRSGTCISYRALTFDEPGDAEYAARWHGIVGFFESDEPAINPFRRSIWNKAGFGFELSTAARGGRRFAWQSDRRHFGSERSFLMHLPYWFLILLFAIAMSPLLKRAYSRRRTAWLAAANRCVQCGYDLRATPDRCPECGTVPAVQRDKNPEKSPGVAPVFRHSRNAAG